MKYKKIALLISIIFIISFVASTACAHPGHGSEYVEEVTSDVVHSSGSSTPSSSSSSSSSSPSSSYSQSQSDSSSYSYSSSSKSSGSGSTYSTSDEIQGTTYQESTSGSVVNDNSSEIEVNKTNKNLTNDSSENTANNELFTVNNVILLICVMLCGFFITVIVSKVVSKK